MTSLPRTAARLLLGATMVGAGVLHLTTQRQVLQAQVPGWFPVDEDLTVLGSGVAEIALGASFLALPRKRRLVGGLLAVFFVVIFPGNVAQYLEGTDAFGLDTDRKRLARLFFQPLLVLWALYGGGWLRRGRRRDRLSRRAGPPTTR
ncbi:DoxX family protein [Blastococcus sp. SYSU DS0828]